MQNEETICCVLCDPEGSAILILPSPFSTGLRCNSGISAREAEGQGATRRFLTGASPWPHGVPSPSMGRIWSVDRYSTQGGRTALAAPSRGRG